MIEQNSIAVGKWLVVFTTPFISSVHFVHISNLWEVANVLFIQPALLRCNRF
jgi:hypothetical protein